MIAVVVKIGVKFADAHDLKLLDTASRFAYDKKDQEFFLKRPDFNKQKTVAIFDDAADRVCKGDEYFP